MLITPSVQPVLRLLVELGQARHDPTLVILGGQLVPGPLEADAELVREVGDETVHAELEQVREEVLSAVPVSQPPLLHLSNRSTYLGVQGLT